MELEVIADSILTELRKATPNGLSRTAISDLFGRNQAAANLQQALESLTENGTAQFIRGLPGSRGGRPQEIWWAVTK